MATLRKLRAEDRELFSLVARIVYTNPFSNERARLEAQILQSSGRGRAKQGVERVLARVFPRIDRLAADGAADFRLYDGPDRELMEYVFLFEAFHRTMESFDGLILEQVAAGDEPGEKPCPAPFAREALDLLAARGFDADTARQHFALCFQIRRAFYFIEQNLVGQSPCMRELRRGLWNNIFTFDIRLYGRHMWDRMEDFSTLLLGETGTGKGSAAAAIGRSGFIPFDAQSGAQAGRFAESFTRAFVSLNLSEFPEGLIESELFGHKKGAFTGATEDHEGVLSACSPHGAIFLDEIGEVSAPTQIKLLRVLQERAFSPVGSHDKLRFHGRVIAATNRGLDELRRSGRFRDDFYYRLCSDVIVVPPLRQRIAEAPAELDELIGHTVFRMLGQDSPETAAMVREAIDAQLGPGYAWPGNVRELEQCVRRVILKRGYEGVQDARSTDLRDRLVAQLDAGSLDADALLAGYCALLHRRHKTYEQVARATKLDRRTVKKYLLRTRGNEADAT